MAEEYRLELLTTAKRDLAKLPVAIQRRIARALDDLRRDPRPQGARLLVGFGPERIWRIRVGEYRVLYDIRDGGLLVLVIRIGHRRDIYRG